MSDRASKGADVSTVQRLNTKLDRIEGKVERLTAERDAARAAINRLRARLLDENIAAMRSRREMRRRIDAALALHQRITVQVGSDYLPCCAECDGDWPCPTVAALTGEPALDPEEDSDD